MTHLLLAEHAPEDGRILVRGAGGGLELKAFADARPGWRFVGVDPSAPMLELAENTLGPLASRVEFIHGEINAAPAGPFDGAICLLTLHFLTLDQRLHAFRQLRERLKPGAPLVVAHHSIAQEPEERTRWLGRCALRPRHPMPVTPARRGGCASSYESGCTHASRFAAICLLRLQPPRFSPSLGRLPLPGQLPTLANSVESLPLQDAFRAATSARFDAFAVRSPELTRLRCCGRVHQLGGALCAAHTAADAQQNFDDWDMHHS